MGSFKIASAALVATALAGAGIAQSFRSSSKSDLMLEACERVVRKDNSEVYTGLDEKFGAVGPKHAIACMIKESNPHAFLLLDEDTREPVRNDLGMIERYSVDPAIYTPH